MSKHDSSICSKSNSIDLYAVSQKQHSISFQLTEKLCVDKLTKNICECLKRINILEGFSNVRELLWVEKVPFISSSEQALFIRNKESNRQLSPENKDFLRVVIVEYKDKKCDLIIVAQKEKISGPSLYELAYSFIGDSSWNNSKGEKITHLDTHSRQVINLDSSTFPSLDWAIESVNNEKLFTENVHSLQTNNKFHILAALGVTLGIYEQTSDIYIGYEDAFCINCSNKPNRHQSETNLLNLSHLKEYLACNYVDLLRERLKGEDSLNSGEQNILPKIGVVFIDKDTNENNNVVRSHYNPNLVAPFDITFVLRQSKSNNYYLHCCYEKKLYSYNLIKGFIDTLDYCAKKIKSDPKCKLGKVMEGISAKSETLSISRPQICNNLTSDMRIEQVFERQAIEAPNSIALNFNEFNITYLELSQQSSIIANNLLKHNIKPGERIVICLERSTTLISTILGILKIGAVYVPVDPNYPTDRKRYIYEDSNAVMFICENLDIDDEINSYNVFIDTLIEDNPPQQKDKDFPDGLDRNDPAYIIYTSGSTGKPKGVIIPHQNVVNLVNSTRDNFELNSRDVWTLFHSPSFDFSVWEIWGALLTGAKLVIVPYWTTKSIDEFYNLLKLQQVTVLNQTPSVFPYLADYCQQKEKLEHIRLIVFGGEPLNSKILLPWFQKYDGSKCRLINMFGITETTVHVTANDISHQDAFYATKNVGIPLTGWSVYILDKEKNILPKGVIGEIYIGGENIAQGYQNNLELTHEKFINNPFAEGDLYRSGDKGRILSNNTLEHHGRIDSQVKLRGYRIELDEIKNVMVDIKGVKSAAVVTSLGNKDDLSTTQIDTYLILDGVDINTIPDSAKSILPDYMLPTDFYKVRNIPLTLNGKVDTQQLVKSSNILSKSEGLNYEIKLSSSRAEFSKEKDKVAHDFAKVWSSVLGKKVEIEDNFFNLGGNSLSAVKIISSMKSKNLPTISYRDLYVHQSIKNIIQEIYDPSLVEEA